MENPEMAELPEKQKHQLRHRELFLSRQLESLPATHIRYTAVHSPGITLLNDQFMFVSLPFYFTASYFLSFPYEFDSQCTILMANTYSRL